MNRFVTRRAFLNGLGISACAAPFLPLFDAHADMHGFPTRLILLFSANGTLYENWAPTGSETNFTLGPILAPLAGHQDQLVILDGVARSVAGPGNSHQKGIAGLWSGARILPGNLFQVQGSAQTVGWGGGISVDQHLATASGAETPYRSLELAAYPGGASVSSRMCYAGPNQPLPPEGDPQALFDRLFADLEGGGPQLEQLRAERRSVIDVVKDHLSALEPQLASTDKIKFEAHLDGIREIERRNELAQTSCDPAGLDPSVNPESPGSFPLVSRAQIDQLVMALSCDLTRVASLQWSRAVSQLTFTWLGHTDTHHDLSHLGNGDPKMTTQITAINAWYAAEVAYLLDALAAVPEGSGTMLDHTLVVWGNELGRGNVHSDAPIPLVLAGGAGGAIQTGRWLNRGEQLLNRVLVSICHAMGDTATQTFGDIDTGSGGFPDLVTGS